MRTPLVVLALLTLVALGLVAAFLAGGGEREPTSTVLEPASAGSEPAAPVAETRLERGAVPERRPARPEPEPAPPPTRTTPAPRPEEVVTVPTIVGTVVDVAGGPLQAELEAFVLGPSGRNEVGNAVGGPDGRYRLQLLKDPVRPSLEQELLALQRTLDPKVEQALEVLEQMERDDRRHRRGRSERDVAGWFRDQPELGRAFEALRHLTGDDELRLHVRATASGYTTATHTFVVPKAAPGAPWKHTVDFRLAAGGAVTGKVVHYEFPAPGVEVTLYDLDFDEVASTLTALDGEYQLPVREAGTYHVLARRTGAGMAMHLDLQLAPLVPTVLPDLLLGGVEGIEGLIAHPDGRAAVGALIEAEPVELAVDDATAIPYERLPQKLLESDLFRGGGRGDDQGRFAIGGLQPGRYRLRLPELDDPALHPETIVETNTKGVRLTYPEPRLLIHVEGELPSYTVVLTPTGETKGPERRLDSDGSRFVSCGVVADATYRASVRTENGLTDSQEVHVMQGRYLTWISLRPERGSVAARGAEVAADTGRLRVRLRGDASGSSDVRAVLIGKDGEPVVDPGGETLDVGERWVTLPAADYLLRLEHDYMIGDGEQPVRVEPRRSTTFDASFALGGRVALQAHGAGAAALPDAFDAELVFLRIASSPIEREVRLTKRQDGSWLTDPPVAPGPYTLRASPDGILVVVEGIDVVRGETVEVAAKVE